LIPENPPLIPTKRPSVPPHDRLFQNHSLPNALHIWFLAARTGKRYVGTVTCRAAQTQKIGETHQPLRAEHAVAGGKESVRESSSSMTTGGHPFDSTDWSRTEDRLLRAAARPSRTGTRSFPA
jgi:hypothetical protein